MHENALVKIRDDMPLDRAALIGCGVTTGVGAVLNTARIEPARPSRCSAAAASGLAAIQGARIAGARMIIAVDMLENKLATARRARRDAHRRCLVAATRCEAIREIDRTAASITRFEAIGLKKARRAGVRLPRAGRHRDDHRHDPGRPEGRARRAVVPAREEDPGLAPWARNRFRIDMPRYIDFYLQGRLKLDEMITRRGRLEDVNEAFRAMKAGEVARTVLMFD